MSMLHPAPPFRAAQRPSWAPSALVVLALLATSGCGGGGSSATPSPVAATPAVTATVTSSPAALVTAAAVVPCSATTSTVALPAGWPTDLPLPPGLVLSRTELHNGTRLIASGRVPGDFHAVVTFFNRELPKSGHPQTDGQLDPDDAESGFGGAASQGRWKVGRSTDCPGQSELVVVLEPSAKPTASP